MIDRDFAAAAVEEGRKSKAEAPGKPLVGVVIVKDGEEVGRSYRGRTGTGEHAEFGLIRELRDRGVDITGAVVYTTLEPCSTRNHPKVPCAEHLAAAGVAEVVIGMYDPNPRIYRDGWRILRDHNIRLRDFPADLREEVAADNRAFADQFLRRAKDADTGVLFDWDAHPAGFVIVTSGGEFRVRFTRASADRLHLHGDVGTIGAPRHAREFDEVDDPAAQDTWEGHTRTIVEGGIGMVAKPFGHLLIKVVEVQDMDRGADQNCVKFDYEYRPTRRCR